MAKAIQPNPDLPWVLKQKGLRLIDMFTDEEGRTCLMFRSPLGPIRELTLTMMSTTAVKWSYGYTIRDTHSKTSTTYSGLFGDPKQDRVLDIEGF